MKVKVKINFEYDLNLNGLTVDEALAELKDELENEFDDTTNLTVEVAEKTSY